jgi:hypothetical protein
MQLPQQRHAARVRWRLIESVKRFAQQGFGDQGPVGCMAVLAVEQLQHEGAQEQHAGGCVLRLFRRSSGSCAAAKGHDPLYHRPGGLEKFAGLGPRVIAARKFGFKSFAHTMTTHGRLMLAVPGGLADFERELIIARIGEEAANEPRNAA